MSKYLKTLEEIELFERTYDVDLSALPYQEKCAYIKRTEEGQPTNLHLPRKTKLEPAKRGASSIADLKGKIVVIAPEIKGCKDQPVKYDEILEDEVYVEDEYFDIARLLKEDRPQDLMSKTYKVKGKSGRKVVAQSTVPKENAGIIFRPDRDIVPVVYHNGRMGYLWKHHKYANIKDLLMASGYYEEYAKQFNGTPNLFYLTGLECCDINKVHSVFNQIRDKQRRKNQNGGL